MRRSGHWLFISLIGFYKYLPLRRCQIQRQARFVQLDIIRAGGFQLCQHIQIYRQEPFDQFDPVKAFFLLLTQ